ncbi:MAG: DUF3179 domain-containing protein [Actinomycetota bacterium]
MASALDDPTSRGLPPPLVDPADIIPGGPPPDGIPALDRPTFERASAAGWLTDREPVLALRLGGEDRAYPIQILLWHEIVNDTVGGVPVVVTYCPLCNSALAFERRAGGKVLDFGTSGKLYQSALVMYDRQTESLWSQFMGQAITGVLTGTTLESLPVSLVSWSEWRGANPQGWVLSRRTGFDRPYGRNPYVGYDTPDDDPFLFRGRPDLKLPPKTRAVGVGHGDDAVAVVAEALQGRRVIEVDIGARRVVVWMKPGAASAVDTGEIREGRDVGQTGVFEVEVDGTALSFEPAGDGFRDVQTGTVWDVFGRGTKGPLAGRELRPVPHVDTFWFAWAAFRPHTRIIG